MKLVEGDQRSLATVTNSLIVNGGALEWQQDIYFNIETNKHGRGAEGDQEGRSVSALVLISPTRAGTCADVLELVPRRRQGRRLSRVITQAKSLFRK